MQPTQFENTCGRVFRTIRFEKNEKIKKKYCLKNHQKNHFSIFVKYILRVHWDCLLALDLEDHSWDDGSRHAEVCHIHSQPPSRVLYLGKGKYSFRNFRVRIFLLVLHVSTVFLGSNKPAPSIMMALHSSQV